MVDSRTSQVRRRVGVVGAYAGGADIAVVRQVRDAVGRVTVSGKNGLKVLAQLEKNEGVSGVDLDPAKYKDRDEPEFCLLEEDWTSRQRDLGLPVIRSQGRYVDKGDGQGLKLAFTEALAPDVVRVISLHKSWLRTPGLGSLLAAVEANDSPLAFVLADAMDPLEKPFRSRRTPAPDHCGLQRRPTSRTVADGPGGDRLRRPWRHPGNDRARAVEPTPRPGHEPQTAG